MKVVILMSTYNGGKFVTEQVNSILAQLPSDGLLLVRDDGSSDDTVMQVGAFEDRRIRIERGNNIGFCASFLTLLSRTPTDADLVMFSDQDDVWLPGKIERAWKHLLPLGDIPGLYCSRQQLVDEELRPLGLSTAWPREPSMEGALAENIVTGCTAALNAPAVRLLQRAGVPDEVRFHDWWTYLAISAMGTVLVDAVPTILYRQHAANAIGRGAGWWGRQLQMVRFLRRNDWVGILLGQVQALWRCYGPALDQEQRELIQRYFRVSDDAVQPQWRLIFSWRRWRQHRSEELLFRGLLVLHRLRAWPPSRVRL